MSQPSPESSRLGVPARLVRVVLGGLATLAGVAGAAAAFLLVAEVVARPSIAPTPARAAAAVGLGFGIAGLFGALASMGIRRVVAGIRGWRGTVDLRLHGSRAAQRVLVAVAGLSFVAALVVAGLSPPLRWLALPLLGVASLAIPLALPVRAPEQACSFCGTTRRNLKSLLAGDATSICDGCARAAMKALAEHAGQRGDAEAWCGGLIHLLPPQCPRSLSRPFVERLVGKARTAAGLRNAAGWALRLGNEPQARELLEELPESERQPWDWVNLGVALSDEGRDAEALAATERAAGDPWLRPWVLNNAVWFRTQLQPGVSAADRARWLEELEEAVRLLEAARPEGWKESLGWFRATEAEVRRRSGDLEGALRALQRAEAEHPLAGEQLWRRAIVLSELGRRDDARAELERALKVLHPEGRGAAEARGLRASLAQEKGED